MKTFLNNKKVHCIPPIFYENGFIIDFEKKAEIFDGLFAKQCTVVQNSSKHPSVFISKTNRQLSTVTFYENEIKNMFIILILTKLTGMTCLVFTRQKLVMTLSVDHSD